MLLFENYVTNKETSNLFRPRGLTQHKTRFMILYYPTLLEESRGNFDNNGYIRG